MQEKNKRKKILYKDAMNINSVIHLLFKSQRANSTLSVNPSALQKLGTMQSCKIGNKLASYTAFLEKWEDISEYQRINHWSYFINPRNKECVTLVSSLNRLNRLSILALYEHAKLKTLA